MNKKDKSVHADIWEKILHGGKIISDREAEELHEMIKRLRKEDWTRNKNNSI